MELTNTHLTRQLEILPVDKLGENITIIGAGAIGSFTALALAKMGFENITVFDFDKIEIENMNCQFYRHSDIGKFKALALKELIKDFTNVDIQAQTTPYERGVFPGILISAVDSMKVRKLIWDNHKENSILTKLLIDPRMGAESGLVYAMNPMKRKDIDSYEKTLYTDENAVQERCTAKATMYTACMLSGYVAKVVKDFVTKAVPYPRVTQWNIGANAFQSFPSKEE
jgi:molybdopterin/thiamine biosynthesis adenylyltransferase